MDASHPIRTRPSLEFSPSEVTGAIGDSVTVLPIVVAVALLTELSLAVMLLWFGVFQIVWGLYYGVPMSVEPMKALAALVLAGALTTGEYLVAGLLAGVVLLLVGTTNTLDRVDRYVGDPVVRGIQFAVALILLETGLVLGLAEPLLAVVAIGIACLVILVGYWNLSALVVLAVGGVFAVAQTGLPTLAVPSVGLLVHVTPSDLSTAAIEATIVQLVMTVGNAALATSLLLRDLFDLDVSADELSTSMGVTNLLAVPLGAMPMCHGSGGLAGKYAFGARTAGANVLLGLGYVAVALGAVGLVVAYPLSMIGIILVLVGVQLGRISLRTTQYPFVVGIGVLGVVVNLGVAFVVGVSLYVLLDRWTAIRVGE